MGKFEEGKSVFLEIFGDTPINKVMDFLIVHQEFDYSMTDIAKLSGVGYSTLKLFWSTLESNKILLNTRSVGRAKMYQLNMKNPAVREFNRFYWTTVNQAVEREFVEKITA